MSGIRLEDKYMAIKELHEEKQFTIYELCNSMKLQRSSYYTWLKRKPSKRQLENEDLAEKIKAMDKEYNHTLGSRRMMVFINRRYKTNYNHKRIRRIMRILGIYSVIRRKRHSCTVRSLKEQAAANILGRNFKADTYNKKWLTDVTELKYGNGSKAYLSAIIDLGDNHIVSWVLGHSNNNELVFKTFDIAVENNPEAHPLFHSDRGFQYTSPTFIQKLQEAGMTRSMSRVGKCVDNGPMEGFWGILKTEMYYLKSFESYEALEGAIADYIHYYNYERYQERLNCMTPMEYHEYLKTA